MTVTNDSNITAGALLTASNQLPFSVIVDNTTKPTVTIGVYTSGGPIVQNAEMLCYKESSPFYYFTIDLKDIINSIFDNIDDELQAEWTWKEMRNWIEDVTLTYLVEDGVNSPIFKTISFTVVNSATQINNDNRLCTSSAHYYDIDQTEKLFVGEHNVGYAYVIVGNGDTVSTSVLEQSFFVDSDDVYFTDSTDDYLIEI